MDNKQETSADIIANMRNLGRLEEESIDKIPRTLMGLGLRTYADRLEAAYKREKAAIEADALAAGGIVEAERHKPGNAAKLREALEPWIAFAEWLLENAGKDALGVAIRDNGPIIRQRLEELRTALSAPPRNCDVGTADGQYERWQAFCDRYDSDCTDCPCDDRRTTNLASCFAKWAQMPYEESGAK